MGVSVTDYDALFAPIESALRRSLGDLRISGKADSLFLAMCDLKIRELQNELRGLVDVLQAVATDDVDT